MRIATLCSFLAASWFTARAGIAQLPPSGTEPAPAAAQAADAGAAAQAAREAEFAQLLTNVRLEGFTTMSGEEGLKADSYSLTKVSKQADGRWKFEAVIHFGKRPVPLAISLPVEWAGDTPVISVTKLSVPLMGTYDARVLFYDGQYVGVWSGAGHGGQIFGKIVPADVAAPGGGDEQAAAEDVPSRSPHWPQYRGTRASGVSEGAALPVSFDLGTGENVKWRVEVPGLAHSSPVVYGDALYVTTAVRIDGQQELRVGLYGDIEPVEDTSEFRFELHCYDKRSGEARWHRTLWQGVPAVKRHPKGSHAASTPAADADRVVAFFGTEGLYCLDHAGNLLWKRDFGLLDSGFFMDKTAQWGFASSPVLHDGRVVVQCDVQDDSFLAVLNGATGEDIWRVARAEAPGWSTPTVYEGGGRAQIICNGWKHMGGYALADGAELWRVTPGGDIPVPTPIVAHGLAYITNAHGRAAPILAIDTNATGPISFAEAERQYLKWGTPSRGNYMQTPLVLGDLAYFCRDNGVVTCYDAESGEQHYSERLDEGRSGYTSSPVAGDGKVYFTSEEGTVVTVKAGPTFEVLARSTLGEEHMATPAISEGVLYFRSRGHLTAIAAQ
ncbi:MAG: PQQ-binding-like beta-propeller repeat protein [Planctomycetota bacterium]